MPSPRQPSPRLIGHRGAAGVEPENTLRSVAAALRLGATAVEIDVHHVDGELVVIHDDRLERTTDGRGRVADHTFAALRTLDAGRGERIPTLEEVIELVGDRAELVIELKGPDTAAPVADRLRRLGGARARGDGFVVSSFDHVELAHLRELLPTVRRGALVAGVPLGYAAFAEALGAHAVHMSLECLRAPFVADAQRRGLEVWVYTVNHADDLAMLHALGVEAVFTDYPGGLPA
ncbi:MAG TPA: glycerophosphodiester phosphodiesterase family protein [Gemmatimonadaceae bacterium]|nr:glycerophosphodiester phosphodiesterase family protein [Gemmatimonadaceae bacterium]